MSEKSALRSEEAIKSPPEQLSSRPQWKERRRARLYKALCFYFAYIMANNMHKYALSNASEAHLARWNELIAPVNAQLSPWIMLFLAPLKGASKPQFLDTTAFFIAAVFAFYTYARFYYQWNEHNDRYQLPILIVAAFVGLVPALVLNVGILISIFCVTPKVAISGLLVSDLLHLVYQGPWQKETKNERVVDEEKGPRSDADKSEQSVRVDEEAL